jgi:exonuclease SbcC
MILLKELKLNNYLSHEKTELVFGSNDKILLDGRSGSGKSSITEAILWILYGRGRSENRSLVRRGAKIASASLRLGDVETDYVITRTVSLAGKNTLVVTRKNGDSQFVAIERTGIKDTQDWIENELLHASYELFTNSVAYPQENENSFVKATAAKRKDLLLEIVRAGNFDELYDKARRTLSMKETETTIAITKIEGLELTIRSSTSYASKYDEYKAELERATLSLDIQLIRQKDFENQLSGISGVLKNIADKKSLRDALERGVSTKQVELARYNTLLENHKKVDIEATRKQILECRKKIDEIADIQAALKECYVAQQKINAHLSNKPQLHDYTRDIELLNQRLIPLVKDSGSCPSGDACPFVVPIKGQIDFLSEQITEKTEKGIVERRAMELWEKEYTILVPVGSTDEFYRLLTVLENETKDLPVLMRTMEEYDKFEDCLFDFNNDWAEVGMEIRISEEQLASVKTEIEMLEASLTNTDKLNEELKTTQMMVRALQNQRDQATASMAVAVKAQEDIKNASEGILEAKRGIEKAVSEKESLELLKEALSPRGIKAVIIDYLVPNLEERINGVLSQMSEFRIRLDTQKATADEEGVKEGLFITVINDLKEELPFTSYSGGEKVKITVAIAEALASLMSSVGFRIMDENIVSLDKESTEGFIEVLTKLQEKFPQLLVISHLQEVKDIFEKQIMVTKINGISRVT